MNLYPKSDAKRYALVIGNWEYEKLEILKNPMNDCKDIEEKLKSFGFQVTSAKNRSWDELYSLMDNFKKYPNDDISDIVFYYAGHGCSIQGKNYIIPVDGIDLSKDWSNRICIELHYIITSLVELRGLDTVPIIIILDCCRFEPVTPSQNQQYKDLIKGEGNYTNIFIMYATSSNQVASDGDNSNGAFTKCLLAHMDTDKDIETISKNVLTSLRQSYRNTQVPWTNSSLLKSYNFRTASKEPKNYNLQFKSPQKNSFWLKYPKNPHFINRPEIFKELDRIINENKDSDELKPIVLCGLGGMGKSQIALEFCYRNKDNYPYTFWMDADTETALQNSFLDVARILNLQQFDYTNAEDIVPQIINWLQNHDRWLLIFDNADDYSLGFTSTSEHRRLQNKYFPKIGKGTIIMTTRNNFAEQDEPKVNLNAMMMNNDTALKLLLRKKVDPTDDEYSSSLKIIHRLGHLPLAIDLTGALIRMDDLKPSYFLKKYDEDPTNYLDLKYVQERTGSNYGKTVLTVWNVSFDRIKSKNSLAASLLQSIAFLYPDNIPFTLFCRHIQAILKLDNTPSEQVLNDALHTLQDFSFIQRTVRGNCDENDPAKVTFTVHRLVQSVILFRKELHEQLLWRDRFISALNKEISSKYDLNNESSQRAMEVYVPHIRHIIMLFSQCAEQKGEGYSNPEELISLVSPTIVYLIRQGLFEGTEYLAKLCVSISKEKNGEFHPITAAAHSKLSYVYVSQRHFELAEPHCRQSLIIRQKIFEPNHKDTISSLHDLAYIYKILGLKEHATQLYWEAAIVNDKDAQKTLANHYKQGVGAPIHGELSLYWKKQSLESDSSDKPCNLYDDTRVDLTPLHYAVQEGDVNKIRARISDYKRYVNIKNRDGKLASHIALENGHLEILKLLVNELKSDINFQDDNGQTLLHLAAKNGNILIVKFLIMEHGADASIVDIDQRTSAELAVEYRHLEIMKFIVLNKAITNLDLKDIKLGDKGTRTLAKTLKQDTALTNLCLKWNGIDDKGARFLADSLKQNTVLTNLNLENNKIASDGACALADSLKQNKVLTNLNLSHNKIGPNGACALASSLKQNTILTNLNLGGNEISDKGAHDLAYSLKQNTVLVNLNLSHNEIGPDGSCALADSLKQNAVLTNLNLSWNKISDKGVCAMAYSLEQNTVIMNLNLSRNNIGDEGARALAVSLKQKTTLTNLDLHGDKIGDEGARALAKSLEQNTTLTNLNLDSNKIEVEGARALAESLKQNTTLTNLNLGWNKIGDEGACALAESLKQNTTLINLNIECDEIGVEGARALAKSLKQNTAITNLNLRDNLINDGGARALTESLKQNKTLTNLDVGENGISYDIVRALANRLRRNTIPANLDLGNNKRRNSDDFTPVKKLKLNHEPIALNLEQTTTYENNSTPQPGSLKKIFPIIKTGVQLNVTNTLRIKFSDSTVIDLDLNRASIQDSGVGILASFLVNNTTLTHLYLEKNGIGVKGACDLGESLKRNMALVYLNLEHNAIGADGACALADGLKQNTSLAALFLRKNQISDNGVHALAESLKQNKTLTGLNLEENGISDDGARSLAEGLKQNETLKGLQLYKNYIKDDGARAFAESLEHNTTLTTLNLCVNRISNVGCALFEKIQSKRRRIHLTLQLDENGQERG